MAQKFLNGIVSTGNILPSSDSTYDLGHGSYRWANLNVDAISTTSTFVAGGTIALNSSISTLNKAQTSYISFATRNTSGSETLMDLTNVGSATFAGNITTSNGLIQGTRSGATEPNSSNSNVYLIDSRSMTGNVGGSIVFGGYYTASDIISGGPYIKGYKENNTSGDYGFGLKFGVRENGSGSAGGPVLTLNSSGNATFAGTVLIDGVSNYTGLTLKGAGASRPALNFRNVNQSYLGSIYGTEGRALIFESGGDGTNGVVSLTLNSSGNATFAGRIEGNDLRLRKSASDQTNSADTTTVPSTSTCAEYLRIESTYTDGRYTHEWSKVDRGGNLPLYLRQSKGTANSFTNLARFGDHSNSIHEFEVFGSAKATHFYGDGSNLTGVTVSNADTVDNLHAASFLRSDAADTATGQLFFDGGFDSHPIMLSGAQNFDNIDRAGFYNLYNTNTGSTNSPGFDYGTMIAIGNDKGSQGFGLQIAHERTGTGMYVRGMNDTASAWSAWAEIWTSTTDGSGSGLDADFLDGVQGSQFLRSDADDTATGIISFTKKIHDYDTIPANQNLLDIGSIKIAGRNDIYGNAAKTVITDYVAKHVNDNTGETTIRIYVDDNILVDGDTYMVSVYYENLIGTLSIDFADTAVTGNGAQTGTSSAPKSGRIYGYGSRADYTSTYRFVDINLSQGSGHEVTLHSPKVEAGTTLTDFVATERTDMPTNSMHVKELIATGGLKVIGPGSHNFIQSENEYTLGFNDSTGVSQWWIKNYTNGNFAIHENNVGDKFTIAAGGAASFAENVTVGGGQILTPGGVNLALNPNTGTVTVGGIIQCSGAGASTFTGDITTSGNIILSGASNEIIKSNGSIRLNIDSDNNQTDRIFIVSTGTNSELFRVDESGNGTFAGSVNVNTNGLIKYEQNTDVDSSAAEAVASVVHGTHTAAFFDYVIKKGTNVRAGIVTACHDGTNVEYAETSTVDLGDTSDVTLSIDISGIYMRLIATTTSNDWSVKSLIRAI